MNTRKVSIISKNDNVICNILVYDSNPQSIEQMKSILVQCNLFKPKTDNLLLLLEHTNLQESDICALFLCESEDENGLTGFDIAKIVHRSRTNIPIFMRLDGNRTLTDLLPKQRSLIAGCYNLEHPEELKHYTDKFLYGFYFPNVLIDIFLNSGIEVLKNTFRSCEIKFSKPFLLYDHIIDTEYTSILPVQFSFGNGILMFLMKEDDALRLIANEHTALKKSQTNCDYLNQLVSEVMNLYWGKVRQHCDATFGECPEKTSVNIPLVVNHKKNYINYGNHVPQLCFRYILFQDASIPEPFLLEFKFLFSNILNPNNFTTATPNKWEANDADTGFEMF